MDKVFKGTINLNGRPKGSLNKTTAQTKEIIKNIVSNQMESFDDLLNKLEPKERIDFIIRLLPFVVPKQSEIAIDNKEEFFKPITVTLIDPNGEA